MADQAAKRLFDGARRMSATKRKRARYYVGFKGAKREIILVPFTPTAETHPQFHGCIGPFRTRHGAMLCVSESYGPVIQTVAEFEREAQRRKGRA